MADQDSLLELERLIRTGREADLEAGRTTLRRWLIAKSGITTGGLTTADAIASISPNPEAGGEPAKVLLRCLAVPHLMPPPHSQHQLARHLVALCEGALPQICEYLHVDPDAQTHDKFEVF